MGKPTPESVEALLTGRRRWTRQARSFDVVCAGIGATVRARTVDVSRGGLLAEAVDGDVPPLHEGDLMPMAYLAAVAFAKGVTVTLAPDLVVRGDVVRVTTSPKQKSFLRLGIRFRRPLTAAQCSVLRIDATDRSDPTFDPATEPPLPPDDEPVAPPPSAAPPKADPPIRIERERVFGDPARFAAPRVSRERALGERPTTG